MSMGTSRRNSSGKTSAALPTTPIDTAFFAFLAATARSMAAALPEAAGRYGALVTGSSTSKVSPSIESTNSPSM